MHSIFSRENLYNRTSILLDKLAPRICAGCKSPIICKYDDLQNCLCPECLVSLLSSRKNMLLKLDSESKVTAIWHYRGFIRELIKQYKYQGTESLKHVFALAAHLTINKEFDALVVVPSTPRSVRNRGFSHMHHIANELAKSTGLTTYPDALSLRKKSHSQMGLALSERKVNRENALVASTMDLLDKRVLVIDDVLTSGQTLKSAITALRYAGANKVEGLVMARTPR